MYRKTIMTNIAYDSERNRFYVTPRSKPCPTDAAKRVVKCYPTPEQTMQAPCGIA